MKKFFSILCAAAAVLAAAASCQNPDDGQDAALEITDCAIAESAEFGQALDFAVTAPAATNVTVALIGDSKQLASETVRESVDGVFTGTLALPYTKNIADGEYDVMVMAMGSGSSRAEQTVKVNLSHPEFAKMAFVSGSDKYEMVNEGTIWSYVGSLPASLSGYFEAEDAAGTKYTFGGSNVDNIEFGNTSNVKLYDYENGFEEATLSFNPVSFTVGYPINALYVSIPATADPAYPGVVEVEFKKGQIVAFTGLGDLWVDIDFFGNNGDGSYTFLAEGGKYRLTNQADWGLLRVERLDDNGSLAKFGWDESGNITDNQAIWCLGNYNFGKPDKRAIRDGREFSDWETYDGYCMAKIDDYKYQITLRVHNYASLKFFKTKLEWGDIASSNYDMVNSTFEKTYLISVAGSDGNFQQGQSIIDPNKYEYPETGVVLRFTFDVTNPLAIKATVKDVTDQNLM